MFDGMSFVGGGGGGEQKIQITYFGIVIFVHKV